MKKVFRIDQKGNAIKLFVSYQRNNKQKQFAEYLYFDYEHDVDANNATLTITVDGTPYHITSTDDVVQLNPYLNSISERDLQIGEVLKR